MPEDEQPIDPIHVQCPRCLGWTILTGSPPSGVCAKCLALATYQEGIGGYMIVYWSYGEES